MMKQALRWRRQLAPSVVVRCPLSSRRLQIRPFSGWTRCAKKTQLPQFSLLLLGAVGVSTCWHRYTVTLCETHETEDSIDEEMVNAYVESLMSDHEMVKLPFGMGKSTAFLLDVTLLHTTLVKEAITSFDWTVDSWNQPQYQSRLAGHPIVYSRTRTQTVRHLLHNPHLAAPFEVLEMVADALLEEPKVKEHHTRVMRWLPLEFKRLVIINMLHVLSSILVDLMLTSSVSVHQGAFEMQWTFHPDKAQAYYDSLKDKATIQKMTREALEQIDYETVEELAAEAMASSGEQNSWVFSLVGHDLYATGYKLMLIVFFLTNWETECRMMGRSVTEKIVKPSKKVAWLDKGPQ